MSSLYASINRREPHSEFVRFTDERGNPVHPKDGDTWQDPRGSRAVIRVAQDSWYTLEPLTGSLAETTYHSGG